MAWSSQPHQHPAGTSGATRATLFAAAAGVAGILAWVLLAQVVQLRTALVSVAVAAVAAEGFRRVAPRSARAPYVVGAVTVLSALLGLLGSQYALVARAAHVSIFTAIARIPADRVPRLMTIGTDALTWVIVALSAFTGIRYAMRLRPLHYTTAAPAAAAAPQMGAAAPALAYPGGPPAPVDQPAEGFDHDPNAAGRQPEE